jgi:hypothetical protein
MPVPLNLGTARAVSSTATMAGMHDREEEGVVPRAAMRASVPSSMQCRALVASRRARRLARARWDDDDDGRVAGSFAARQMGAAYLNASWQRC